MILDMTDFDAILGMDWLSKHHVLLDCHRKRVVIKYPREEVIYHCPRPKTSRFIISAMKATRLIKNECSAFIASVIVGLDTIKTVKGIKIIRDFFDVFSEELVGPPPVREIDLTIKLTPGVSPISIAPNRMAPAELVELKRQL